MKDHEVVISGISGSFPECLNMQELEQKIYTKENLVTQSNSRWRTREIPWQLGKMKEWTRFDDTFFGIHRRLTVVLDPHAKHSFEKTYEAIVDAGRNPADFYGSNTAIFMASSINETEGENMLESKHIGHLILGYSRCMQSNRVSYAFNFKGPSVTVVGSWENSLQALSMAHNMIRRGHARAAVVGASNITMYPQISHNYRDLGRLNDDGKTKSFSADADGYSRSDGVVLLFLQRAEDALRSYGSVVKVLSRAQMDNRAGLLDPYGFNRFLSDFYSDVPVKPSDIAYIEGDGSASLKTDAMELNAMAEVLCPGRNKPLPVTCCKTKLGHAEATASFMSIASALVAMKTGYIPPVLHYTKPNPLVPALKDGTIKIVTEKTPLEGDYVGVSIVGLFSTFGHILMKRNPKTRPQMKEEFPDDGIPRLFLLSGRDETAMNKILGKIQQDKIDHGHYALNHLLFRKELPKHLYRGFSIKGEKRNYCQVTPYPGGAKRPVWYIFSGMGSQWAEMGRGIMKIPIIRASIERSHRTLLSKGIDLISVITNTSPKIYDNILNCFVGIAAIQIALVDLLEELGIKPDGMVGHSVGELGCGYADKCMTAEQMILAAYARGTASNEVELIKGMMAAVGKGYKEMKNEVPEGIEIACHNSETSCTLSGPAQLMEDYVRELKSQGVFAKLVNVANIAYHSKNITPAAPLLLKYLKKIIPEPKMRSSKWISSSVAQGRWETDLARYCSAEYHTNNLLSYVLFEEAVAHVPENAICIEIAPHGLLQAIVKKSLPTCSHIPLTSRAKEGCSFTIEALALLYCCGVEMDLTKLYPKVEFPVPRETEFLHNFVTWNHTEEWIPISLERDLENIKRNVSNMEMELFSHPDEGFFLPSNHRIAGSATYPAANLMCILMESLTEKLNEKLPFKCYEFQDIKFFEALNIDKISTDKLKILYQSGAGKFELLFGERVLMVGELNPATSFPDSLISHHVLSTECNLDITHISAEDIYKFFEEKDCTFNHEFRNIVDINFSNKAFIGRVKWQGNAQYYIDAILKLIIFHTSITKDSLVEIESIAQVIYDPTSLPNEDQDIFVFYDVQLGQVVADGVRMSSVKTTHNISSKRIANPEMGKQVFVPYSENKSQSDFLEECFQFVVETAVNENINVIGDEKCRIFQTMMQNKYFNDAVKSKANIKVVGSEGVSALTAADSASSSGSYLILAEAKLPTSLVNFMETSNHNCYLIQSASNANTLTVFKKLSPILEQDFNKSKLVFYKKPIKPMMEANFIQVPEGFLLEKPDSVEEIVETKKSNFLLFKYKSLSDIPKIVEANAAYSCLKNTRLVFCDVKTPDFDPSSEFYLKQFRKDLKMNVCHQGVWGSLRDVTLSVPLVPEQRLMQSQLPLNNIRCNTVDLKILGLNMQNFVSPTDDLELGVLEYAGVRRVNKEVIMGVGKLTADNTLWLDPILVWKKPQRWTMQQAATVPLYYSMAYYLLQVKSNEKHFPNQRIFVHGAHTAFSQALIYVGLAMKSTVFTTCFSKKQKQLILKRFPQMEDSKVYVLDECSGYAILDNIANSTDGEGMNVVVDCLDDSRLRNITMQYIGKNGKYFLVCHNNSNTDFTFGMSIFLKEASVLGINPELMFDMDQTEKRRLVELVQRGMDSGEVVPLDTVLIDGANTRHLAAQAVVSACTSPEEVKKVVVNLDQAAGHKPGEKNSASLHNKNYLIIGSYNSLWFDMLNWLASWGAKNIYIILEQSTIPNHIQIRLKNFMKRHSTVSVRFLDIESLSSSEKCLKTLQGFSRRVSLDKAFYILPGLESEVEYVDSALRIFSPNCWLVCIGKGSSNRVTNNRNMDGFKGISFVLKKDTLRNRTIVNVLDHWLRKSHHQDDHLILLDEVSHDESGTVTNDPEILPQTVEDLVELGRDPVSRPLFTEVSTLCLANKFAKELDPIFFFPGFKVSKTKNLISKLCYPSYLAKYPSSMKSIDDIAAQFSKELVRNFDLYMFTLVAEGWAGPLVLRVAHQLELQGKTSEVILLDAAPSAVKRWSKNLATADGIISRCIPSLRKDEEITVDHLKKLGDRLSQLILKEDEDNFSEDEVRSGLDAMIARLEMVSLLQDSNLNIASKVHLFTARDNFLENHGDITEINEITRIACDHHVVEGATNKTLLESKQLVRDISNLVLVEYKSAAKKQNLGSIATLQIRELR